MKTTIALVTVLALIITGCAMGGGAHAHKRTVTTLTNGVEIVETVDSRLLPFVAWGDARNSIGRERVSNTKTGNSIGIDGVDQETSATNVAPIMKSGGALIGEAAAQFLKTQGL